MSGWSITRRLSLDDITGYTPVLILMWLIFLVLGIWVYYSAEKYYVRGIFIFVFVLLTVLTGPIGIITYLLLRDKCVK
ncbi:hypothetical protein ACLIA0_13455 [Bacillaceae bacterium W0354]